MVNFAAKTMLSPINLQHRFSSKRRTRLISLKLLLFWGASGILLIYWSALIWFLGSHLPQLRFFRGRSPKLQRTLRSAAVVTEDTAISLDDKDAAAVVAEAAASTTTTDTQSAEIKEYYRNAAAVAVNNAKALHVTLPKIFYLDPRLMLPQGAKNRYDPNNLQQQQQQEEVSNEVVTLSPKIPSDQKYLMFLPIPDGQGLGNILNGLLAAHLFGDEFNRRVCVSTEFKAFHLAFQPVKEGLLQECALLPQLQGSFEGVALYNYGYPPDECALRDLLASPTQVLFYVGNTYPRWPSVPERYFESLYRPRPELLEMLPWKTTKPPETVVHLRQPDLSGDYREGLDDRTLELLGQTLPRDTFLVTNRVEWYTLFETNYGWSHPEWDEVFHSANRFGWGSRNVTTTTASITATLTAKLLMEHWSTDDTQSLQMCCDWYTIAQGKHVLHTHSDFSLSAIHFMNIHNSQTILGTDESSSPNTLKLVEESWRRDGETPRLVDRTRDNLRLCGSPQSPY